MSKNSILLVAIIIIAFTIYSFRSTKVDFNKDSSEGIQFFKGTFQEALLKAQTENKPIFLDIYATWCGPCKMLKRKTFSAKEVGDYYNANFISIAVNGETNEGNALAHKYNVQGYPTLLILDKNGKQLTKQVGFVEPHILVNFGRRIVP